MNGFVSLDWGKIKLFIEGDVLLTRHCWKLEKISRIYIWFWKGVFYNVMWIIPVKNGLNLNRIGPFILIIDNQWSLRTRCIEFERGNAQSWNVSNIISKMYVEFVITVSIHQRMVYRPLTKIRNRTLCRPIPRIIRDFIWFRNDESCHPSSIICREINFYCLFPSRISIRCNLELNILRFL